VAFVVSGDAWKKVDEGRREREAMGEDGE